MNIIKSTKKNPVLKNSVVKKIFLKSQKQTGYRALRKKPIMSLQEQHSFEMKKIQRRFVTIGVRRSLNRIEVSDKEKRARIQKLCQDLIGNKDPLKEKAILEKILIEIGNKKKFSIFATNLNEFIEMNFPDF